MKNNERREVLDQKSMGDGAQQEVGFFAGLKGGVRPKPQFFIKSAGLLKDAGPQEHCRRDAAAPDVVPVEQSRPLRGIASRKTPLLVGAAASEACNMRVFPAKAIDLVQEIGRIPAVVIRKANDFSLSEGQGMVAGARQSFAGSQMDDWKKGLEAVQKGNEPVISVLIGNYHFQIFILLCCDTLEKPPILSGSIESCNNDTETHFVSGWRQ